MAAVSVEVKWTGVTFRGRIRTRKGSGYPPVIVVEGQDRGAVLAEIKAILAKIDEQEPVADKRTNLDE